MPEVDFPIPPGPPNGLRNYTQRYQYDKTGNITEMKHNLSGATADSWTRAYKYAEESSQIRKEPSLATDLTSDETLGSIRSIVTSNAQNDDGMFETNFRDERYLPFEGAGAISTWNLELPRLKQFDYKSISDVIIHMSYMAVDGSEEIVEGSTTFKDKVIEDYPFLIQLVWPTSEPGLC